MDKKQTKQSQYVISHVNMINKYLNAKKGKTGRKIFKS